MTAVTIHERTQSLTCADKLCCRGAGQRRSEAGYPGGGDVVDPCRGCNWWNSRAGPVSGKKISTLSRVGPQSKAPRSLPTTQGQRARPSEGVSSGAPGSSLGCAPGRKLAIQRTKGPARRKKPPRRETARGIERVPTRKLKRSPHLMRSGAGQTGTGLGGSVTTRRLHDNTPRDRDVNCRLRKRRPESRPCRHRMAPVTAAAF